MFSVQYQQIPFQFALPFTNDEWRALLSEQLPAKGDTIL
jgi:hypothetical protein